MRKPDEIALAREMLKYGAYGDAHHLSDMTDYYLHKSVSQRLGINNKRAAYIFRKWARRGWSDYFQPEFPSELHRSLRFSWLLPKGVEAWTNILSICDATDDGKCDTRCIAQVVVTFTGGHYNVSLGYSYCPEIRHYHIGFAVFHSEQNVFVTLCTIPLLE